MAAVIQSSSTTAVSGGDLIITKPSGLVVGDLMIAQLVFSSGSITNANGFTLLNTTTNSITTLIYYKIADSGDVAASNFNFSNSGIKGGALLRIDGHITTGYIVESAAATASATSSPSFANTITPHQNSSLILMFVSNSGSNITTSGYAIATSNPSWTELYDINSGSGSFSLAYATRPEVTATGNSSATGSGSTNWIGQTLAVVPILTFSQTDTVTSTDTVTQAIVMDPIVDTVTPTDTVTSEKQKTWATQNKSSTTWINQDKS